MWLGIKLDLEKNLISSTGFVGRISQIMIRETGLDISYVRTFWRNKDISSYRNFKNPYCITGTIPKYLEREIDPKLTARRKYQQFYVFKKVVSW